MIEATVINNPGYDYGYDNEPYIEPIEKEEKVEDFAKTFSDMFNAFADSIPNNKEASSKNIFKRFADYIGSKRFTDDVNAKAEKYKIPPKQLAKNFFFKVLGIIGDILGIVVNTACSIVDTAVSLLANLLHGAVEVIAKVGNAITSVVTCNQTNLA